LERAAAEVGLPKTIHPWAFMRSVRLEFSRPGKATDDACIESFKFPIGVSGREFVFRLAIVTSKGRS
jgi:hypothetical protein